MTNAASAVTSIERPPLKRPINPDRFIPFAADRLTQQIRCRPHNKYGGRCGDQLNRPRRPETGNTRLRRAVSDPALDKMIETLARARSTLSAAGPAPTLMHQ